MSKMSSSGKGRQEGQLLFGADEKSKAHENLCKETKKVTATGTVKEEDGKKVMTVTSQL
jgi:hypothetical protein